MTGYATRPAFAEGQILAATDLAQLSSYPRAREERHSRFVHRWGIVTGLALETEAAEDTSGNAFVRVFVTPGLAVDGEGRELLVTERALVDPDRFRKSISNIDKTAAYPVFLRSQYRASGPDPTRVGPCGSATGGGAVEEAYEISFGSPGDETGDQVASAISNAPTPEEGSTSWLILLGFVKWDSAPNNFVAIDADAAARHRPFIGINAAVVAGDGGQVQLQARREVAAGDAVFQLLQTDDGPELRFGAFKASGQDIDPLLTVDAKGDLTTLGSLTGRRTGNSVQVQSGVASHGVILPLPPGVTQAQVDAGEATVHVHVAPLIDPAAAPVPGADYAALVQECRVDEDRRVQCRIAWCSLPFGTPMTVLGAAMVSGPGAVSYLVAVATSGGGA
ncbi:hypothetical protein OKW76_04460 [Sphingomonas sp. S1-29]|uniref:hypothetical protein n=1 Tax=Sphingomonas sp. S1-29 TaxID=2991074 RepID=UPI002240C1D2|nr:hypothetical protein [Sphingomonas sp. S1-29]UZK70303.1 hypothetical protein OKW76_04460 [Sphingomonas sp. S1-29]